MSDSFRVWLLSLGIRPRSIIVGKWVRCGTESHPRSTNGAYFLLASGERGWAMDWASHTEPLTWVEESDAPRDAEGAAARLAAAMRPEDRAALEEGRAELRENQRRASREAHGWYWESKPLRGGHPYLEDHGLTVAGCARAPHGRYGATHGLREDVRGRLVVPVQSLYLWRGKPWTQSVQLIEPGGEKRYWPGAPVKGGSYLIDARPDGASRLLLCEGLATGLALYGMVDGSVVRTCFSAGGLIEIAKRVAEVRAVPGDSEAAQAIPYLHLPHTVCGDNDHRTTCKRHKEAGLTAPFEPWAERPEWCLCNPGRATTERASAILGGCAAAIPTGIDGTDWSDWVQAKERAYLPAGKFDRLRHHMAGARAELAGLLAARRR